MTASMRCIDVTGPGGPDVLVLGSRPCPTPKDGEVLIKVAAAGVNRPDCLQRQGLYPAPPDASDILGLEAAGIVVAVGAGVRSVQEGDRVCALLHGGGYADYVTAHADHCLPIPAGFSMVQAAAIPETAFTVWHNVFQRGALKAGETLLVHGGSSGIGTMAIQMAKAFGATVYTTAGSAEKCTACESLGADRAINYRQEDFVEVIKSSPTKGVDVILDMVGGDYIAKATKVLRHDGRHVSIAFLQGSKVQMDFMSVMLKRLVFTGSTLRSQTVAFKAALAAELKQHVWPLLDQGKITPLIHQTFPLDQAAAAHHLMESSAHIGKLVLTMD